MRTSLSNRYQSPMAALRSAASGDARSQYSPCAAWLPSLTSSAPGAIAHGGGHGALSQFTTTTGETMLRHGSDSETVHGSPAKGVGSSLHTHSTLLP